VEERQDLHRFQTVFFPTSPDDYSGRQRNSYRAKQIKVPGRISKERAAVFFIFQLFRSSLPFDEYLKEDGIWPGYVSLKSFSWQALLPENSFYFPNDRGRNSPG